MDYEIHQALKGSIGNRLGIVIILLENRNDTINEINYSTFPARLSDNEDYTVLIQNASLKDKIRISINEADKNRKNNNIQVNNKRACMKLPNKYYGI